MLMRIADIAEIKNVANHLGPEEIFEFEVVGGAIFNHLDLLSINPLIKMQVSLNSGLRFQTMPRQGSLSEFQPGLIYRMSVTHVSDIPDDDDLEQAPGHFMS
jgi:hypothetical protein